MATPKYEKHPGGRPLKYQTPDELEKAIDEYFSFCDNRIQQVYSPKAEAVIEVINPAPYTMSGLARAIGLDRKSLLNYSNREEFFLTIKAAREKVQEDVETRLLEKQATGAIFNLKNNFGWVDEYKHEDTIKGDLTLNGSQAEQLIRERANRRNIKRDSD